MKYQIICEGAFPMVKINLERGEKIKAESGAMVAMEDTVKVEGKIEGGILKGIGRMFAGENFFFQQLSANNGAGEVLLSTVTPGGIKALELDGTKSLRLQKDGFLAASDSITVDTKMQNLTKGFFSGEGFFILNVSGKGTVFVSSFGEIYELEIPAGKEYVVDNQHLVAWDETIPYKIEKSSSGWISSITSGEMLVCRFTGPGKVYIQSRNPKGFGNWINQFIPKSTQ